MKRIAVVVQRYGKEVLGGSETLARDIAHMLRSAYDVEVLTTCAMEYTTWANDFAEGESIEDGIRIRRFQVDKPRSRLFKPYNLLLRHIPHTIRMEKLWMRMQGPCSAGMKRYVAEHHDDYDLFVFVTYLYCTTYDCLPLVKDRAVLVPTAHDEPFIRFGIFRDIFNAPRALIYLTDEEKTFTDGLFGLDTSMGAVAGAPVRVGEGSPEAFRKKYGIDGDFILYLGRMEEMKGLEVLLAYFERYRREHKSSLKLVLCGKGPLKVAANGHVITPGYVQDSDKYGAIRAALAVAHPSPFESFSYTLIESMLCGTPVIVNGACNVLKAHIEKSGAGFSYTSYEEFKLALDSILSDPVLRQKMGVAGMDYVIGHYSADAVGRKYISTIDGLVDRK